MEIALDNRRLVPSATPKSSAGGYRNRVHAEYRTRTPDDPGEGSGKPCPDQAYAALPFSRRGCRERSAKMGTFPTFETGCKGIYREKCCSFFRLLNNLAAAVHLGYAQRGAALTALLARYLREVAAGHQEVNTMTTSLKHTRMYKIFSLVGILLLLSTARADVRLPSFFSDGMVLQQKTNVRIWGMSAPGEHLTVRPSWSRQSVHTKASPDGKWTVSIQTPSAGGPYSCSIKGKNTIVLKDVLIGEVWLCSGQSNMDMPVKGYMASPVEHSNDILLDCTNPSLRLFHVARAYAGQPQSDVKGSWQQADPASVSSFSAVGYQFAAILQKNLRVPVGIIQATWGGSPVEAWMDSVMVSGILGDSIKTDRAISKAVHQVPGNLYNGMIAPLAGYGIAGVLWYQGEQNRHNYKWYAALQKAMVGHWRKAWNLGDWPFYYVQIAPMRYPESQSAAVPRLREVQLKLMDEIPNSGMAVTLDVGEEHNIHPSGKTAVSKRLAYLALANAYKQAGLAFRGPECRSVEIAGEVIKLKFSYAVNGLTSFGKALTQFEAAGADRTFWPAKAEIHQDEVWVWCDKVKSPLAVRYAFTDWAVGELYNVEGIPASSFRTDDW